MAAPMDTLFTKVLLTDGREVEYIILGTMPTIEFAAAIAKRHGSTIKRITFEDARPAVAEVLTEVPHGG